MMSVCTEQVCVAGRSDISYFKCWEKAKHISEYPNRNNAVIATLNGMWVCVFDYLCVVLAALQSKMDAQQLSILYSVHRQEWKLKCPQSTELASYICIAAMDVISVNVCVCVYVILCVWDMLARWPRENPAELFIFSICLSINLLIWRLKEPSSKLCVSTAQPNNDK